MEIINKKGKYEAPKLVFNGKQLSKRAFIVSQIEKLTGVSLRSLLFKHLKHIPGGDKGTALLGFLYDEAMGEDDELRRRVKFWTLLKSTKVIEI